MRGEARDQRLFQCSRSHDALSSRRTNACVLLPPRTSNVVCRISPVHARNAKRWRLYALRRQVCVPQQAEHQDEMKLKVNHESIRAHDARQRIAKQDRADYIDYVFILSAGHLLIAAHFQMVELILHQSFSNK